MECVVDLTCRKCSKSRSGWERWISNIVFGWCFNNGVERLWNFKFDIWRQKRQTRCGCATDQYWRCAISHLATNWIGFSATSLPDVAGVRFQENGSVLISTDPSERSLNTFSWSDWSCPRSCEDNYHAFLCHLELLILRWWCCNFLFDVRVRGVAICCTWAATFELSNSSNRPMRNTFRQWINWSCTWQCYGVRTPLHHHIPAPRGCFDVMRLCQSAFQSALWTCAAPRVTKLATRHVKVMSRFRTRLCRMDIYEDNKEEAWEVQYIFWEKQGGELKIWWRFSRAKTERRADF